jgi:guanosine-3',5'-bis(diphosphate) 3'-pyrophosphohydrolase
MDRFEGLVLAAVSFAARVHRHQLRKDELTPYVAHPMRVALIIRHLFGCDDPHVLAAALLHDVLEDTTADYDDLVEQFGTPVAQWVAALTKDKRLPEEQREAAYAEQLRTADWQVQLIKLADMYDNLTDSRHLPPPRRAPVVHKIRRYWQVFSDLPPPPPLIETARRYVERALGTCE